MTTHTAPEPPSSSTDQPHPGRSSRLHPTPEVAVAVAYITAMFMVGVDSQIINVSLPTLARDLSASFSAVQWTAIAYLLALAVLIPASGWIGERFGVKQTFLFSLALFTAASALCGAAHTLGELIAARALQGAGGGMMTPSGMAMLFRTFPVEKRAKVARTVLVPILIGPGLAPILGGVLIDGLSWRWVFLINVPVGVPMLMFAWRFLPHVEAERENRLDMVGMLLSALGLVALLYAVSEGSALGWGSAPVVLSGITGVLLLSLFVRWSLTHHDPILRLRLLGNRIFGVSNIVFGLTTGPFLGSLYLTPIFLQEILHQSPVASGTTTFLEAVGVGIGAQTFGRLYPRFGPRPMATVGAAALVVYLCLFMLVNVGTSLWLVRALMLFGGLANSGAFLAVQTGMTSTIPPEDLGHASAIYNTQRQTSTALNIAVLTTIAAGTDVRIGSFHSAYLAAAVIATAGMLCAASLIRTSDARATMTFPPAEN